MMKPNPGIRYEMTQTEATAIHRYYEALPEAERVEIGLMAERLTGDIRNLGATSAVSIIWSIGRLMKRTEG